MIGLVGTKPHQMTPSVSITLAPVPTACPLVTPKAPAPNVEPYEVVLHKASLTCSKKPLELIQPDDHRITLLFLHDGRHANTLRLAQARKTLEALRDVAAAQAAASVTFGSALGATVGAAAKGCALKGAVAGPKGALVGGLVGATLCLGRTLWNQNSNRVTLKAAKETLEVLKLYDQVFRGVLEYGELISRLVEIEEKKDERAKSSMLAFRELERHLLSALDDWHRDAMLEYNVQKNALEISRLRKAGKFS